MVTRQHEVWNRSGVQEVARCQVQGEYDDGDNVAKGQVQFRRPVDHHVTVQGEDDGVYLVEIRCSSVVEEVARYLYNV